MQEGRKLRVWVRGTRSTGAKSTRTCVGRARDRAETGSVVTRIPAHSTCFCFCTSCPAVQELRAGVHVCDCACECVACDRVLVRTERNNGIEGSKNKNRRVTYKHTHTLVRKWIKVIAQSGDLEKIKEINHTGYYDGN